VVVPVCRRGRHGALRAGLQLYELGRHREAYRHPSLHRDRSAVQLELVLVRKGGQALGLLAEARAAYFRAIAVEEAGDQETDPRELLRPSTLTCPTDQRGPGGSGAASGRGVDEPVAAHEQALGDGRPVTSQPSDAPQTILAGAPLAMRAPGFPATATAPTAPASRLTGAPAHVLRRAVSGVGARLRNRSPLNRRNPPVRGGAAMPGRCRGALTGLSRQSCDSSRAVAGVVPAIRKPGC
jgi:hypothetical protein